MLYLTKIIVSSILLVCIAEIAKRNSLIASLIASLPLVSILAMVWLYIDTKDSVKVANLATGTFWFVLPSLALFISLPLLIKKGFNFYLSLIISCTLTIICYALMLVILKKFNIKL